MVKISFDENFERAVKKIKDNSIKQQIEKHLFKIKENPEIGKPMQYERKNTREVYIGSFRLSYAYAKEINEIIILDFYHKDEQ